MLNSRFLHYRGYREMDINELLKKIIAETDLIEVDDIPNIDLYMDQVTTFMDKHLHGSKRFDDDKALTKTMINNYAKNELLPSPEKKKYSKEHIMLLTYIYYYKNILSISDIKKLLQPITDKYFQSDSDFNYQDIYMETKGFIEHISNAVIDDVQHKKVAADQSFDSIDGKDGEYLRLFSLVSMLCFDIYMKKQLVEAIVDTLDTPISKTEKEKLQKKEQELREKQIKKERKEKEDFKK